jgi:hypothetical protein
MKEEKNIKATLKERKMDDKERYRKEAHAVLDV